MVRRRKEAAAAAVEVVVVIVMGRWVEEIAKHWKREKFSRILDG